MKRRTFKAEATLAESRNKRLLEAREAKRLVHKKQSLQRDQLLAFKKRMKWERKRMIRAAHVTRCAEQSRNEYIVSIGGRYNLRTWKLAARRFQMVEGKRIMARDLLIQIALKIWQRMDLTLPAFAQVPA